MVAEPSTAVCYHGPNCADGFTAAWCAWLTLGDSALYLPLHPDEMPEGWREWRGRDVYFLDLCPRREALSDLIARSCRVWILDHHAHLPARLGCLLDPYWRGKVDVTYDPGKSGARLAWEHFHPGSPAPFLVELVEDRDLWRWRLPLSRELNAWLGTLERDFAAWSEARRELENRARRLGWAEHGATLLRYQRQLIDHLAGRAETATVAGHAVPCVNAPVLQSEVAGELAAGQPFAACWSERGGWRHYSLRSAEGGLDVGQIAAALGGGGHPRAAGFRVPAPPHPAPGEP